MNGRPVQVQGLDKVRFLAGTNSHGVALLAQANRAQLIESGVDVTSALVVDPS